jgi:prepilin-type processing-associated H-X9-DG protein
MFSPHDSQANEDPAEGAVEKGSLARTLLKVAVVAVLLIAVGIAFLVPAIQSAREAAQRASCQSHLKQIGLALHNYLATYGSFPPAYTVDADGRPMHSWRALILPSFEGGLDADYDFTEPWDGPNNLKLIEQVPYVYRCPSDGDAPPGTTNYAAVVGDETFWPNSSSRKSGEVSDGLSYTVAVVEVSGLNIPWTKPVDLEFGKIPVQINPGSGSGIASQHGEGVDMLMADGSVRFVRAGIDSSILRALLTVAGGEEVSTP